MPDEKMTVAKISEEYGIGEHAVRKMFNDPKTFTGTKEEKQMQCNL